MAIAMVLCVTGCPKKKTGEAADAAAEAATAEVDAAPPATVTASNADAVARFPDEAAIDHQAATLQWNQVNARESPPSGEVVGKLTKGANVTQIASHGNYILVIFDNPSTPGDHLMGWVLKDVFNAPGHVAPKGPCPAGQTALVADEHFCAHVCKVDKDCQGGQACTGTANLAVGDGGAGAQVHNCVAIAHPDAGVTPPAPPTPQRDAGPPAPPPPAPAPPPIVDPTNGTNCPANYLFRPELDKKCHKACKTNPDCGLPGTVCTRGGFCKTGP